MSDPIGSAFLASRVGAVPITITTSLDPEEIEAAAKLELGLEGQVAVTVYDPAANELLVLDVLDRTGAATLLEEAVVDRCPFARLDLSSIDGLGASVCDSVGDGSTAPVWKHASECYQCKAIFTWGYGLYAAVNRHHCRRCGASACDEHSTHVLQLPQFGHSDPQRVCDECWGTAPPESKGVNSTEEELSFVKTVVAESGGHLSCAELAKDAIAKEHKLLTALAARLDSRVHTTQRTLEQAQQTLPRVRKILEDAEALAKSDSAAPEVDHSVINFSYSSPQLTKLGGQVSSIRAALVAAEEQLATRGTEFTAAVGAAQAVAGRITAAVQDMMKATPADWGVAFGHKIAGLTAAAEGLGPVSAASYDDEATRHAVCDAHNVVIKARRELRAMVVKVVKHTVVAADATRGCGVEYLAFSETLGPVDAAARELTQVLADIEHSLHQWHRRRKTIVSAGHRKDQIWQGNLHHKLNQKIKLLETENGALKTKLANDKTSLALTPTSVRAAPSDHQSAVDKTVAQLRTERETLLKTIGELSARLDARQHDEVQEKEGVRARARAAGQRVGFLEMSQRCDALQLENQVLGEKLGAEQRLNQRRLRELQGTAQDIAASNQSLSDERDALRAHMEQMAEHQGVIQQNAEAMRKRGFSSEEALIRYHEALVHIYRTVHPAGGNGDSDENRLALREDSELPDDVARLVDDFTAANALVVGKLEQLEQELATRPDGDCDGDGGGDHFVDAQSGLGDAAAMAHVNISDVPKWGSEVIRLRAMGFDAPHARLVAMLDQTHGNMQEAANRLLEIL